MITGPSTLAGSLLDSLDAAVAPSSDRQLQGFRRRPTESLNPPALDPDFVERCRVAVAKLVAAEDEGLIAVSSARRGEGRSTVAAAVAMALSRSRADGRVLLLDLDFGRSRQADLLSVAPSPGLADFLEGRERLRLVAGGPNRQLWHVPAGTCLNDRLRLFHVVASEGLLSVFRQRFQWVVVDLPPVLGHPETTPLLRQADWQLIVGRHRRTTLADLREVGEVVDDDKPRGFLLTADSTRIPSWIRRLL